MPEQVLPNGVIYVTDASGAPVTYANPRAVQGSGNPGGPRGGGGTGGTGGTGGNTPPPSPGLPTSDGNGPGIAIGNVFDASNIVLQWQPAGQNYKTSYFIREYMDGGVRKPANAIRHDIYFNDFSGGIDAQIRPLSDGVFSNELAASYLHAYSRTLCLPPLVTSDATATNSIGTLEAMSACFVDDNGTRRWLASAGDTANKALFALTTSVTAQTYSPGSNITSLTAVAFVTTTQRVIVGRAGGAAQVLTGFNGTPTTSGTMHANTTALWGIIVSSLNSVHVGYETLLMYCNAGLYTLSCGTSAIGDAPTKIYTWPNGGYAVGQATLWNEGVQRAYWVHPLNSSSTSMLDSGAAGRIVSTNLEGTDFKVLDLPGLSFVKWAYLWRGGIVASDGRTVVWINSETTVNLGWNRERRWENPGTGIFGFGVIEGLAVVQDRLLVASATITAATGDYANPSVWEEYNLEENKWQFFVNVAPGGDLSVTAGLDSVIPNISMFTGRTPVYAPFDTGVDNGLFYWYAKITDGAGGYTYEWQRCPLLPAGVNPNFQQAQAAYITYQFDNRRNRFNYAITPEYHLSGAPMVVAAIQYKGTLKGEDAEVLVAPGVPTSSGTNFGDFLISETGQFARFVEDTDWRKNWWINPRPQASVTDRLQFMFAVKQGNSGAQVSKSTPNVLPLRAIVYEFTDGVYKDPRLLEPHVFWGGIK